MTALWLATRLAIAGGRLRAALVIAGCALAAVLLLITTSVPGTLPVTLDPGQKRLFGVVIAALVLPVIALLAAVTRLSATVRDRRLAALRVLGVAATTTRAVAAVEAALLAATGAALGALLFLLARPGLVAVDSHSHDWLSGQPLQPGIAGWASGTVGVVLAALVVASFPGRNVTGSPLATRRQASAPRPSPARLLPLGTGAALLAAAAVVGASTAGNVAAFWLFAIGSVATGLGIPLAVPVLVRLVADTVARHSARPVVVLAARRAQQEPAAATRLVSSLLVGLFVLTGGLSVLAVFTTTPQYQRAERAATTGPQAAAVTVPDGRTLDASALRSLPGVRALGHADYAQLACTPGQLTAQQTSSRQLSCTTAIIATCADLPALQIKVTDCVDGQPTWLRSTFRPVLDDPTTTPPTLVNIDYSPDGNSSEITDSLTLPTVTKQLPLATVPGDPNWAFNQDALLLPPDTEGIGAFTPPDTPWPVVLDGGKAALHRFSAAAAAQGLQVDTREDLGPYRQVQAYRDLLWAVSAVVLGVGLLALLITGIDRAVERRRHLASLATLGVPTSLSRRSQYLQVATPLMIGLPLAGAAGLCAGYSFLSYGERSQATPWAQAILLTAVALIAGNIVAALTVTGLGGRIGPADLRRE